MSKRIAFLMIVVLPFGLIGNTIHQGHLNAMILFVYLAGVLSLPQRMIPMGVLSWSWLATAMILVYLGRIPPEMYTARLDSSLIILMGVAWAIFVYRSQIEKEQWFDILCVSALVQSFIGFHQFFLDDPVSTIVSMWTPVRGDFTYYTATGLTGNPNYLGAYLAICLPLFFRARWLIGLPVIVTALLISKSTGGFGSAVIGCLYYAWGVKGALTGASLGVVHYFLTHEYWREERLNIWTQTIELCTLSWDRLLLGYGPGAQAFETNMIHNEYLNMLFQYGTVGLGLMVQFIRKIFTDDRLLNTSLLILLINMIPNHPFHEPTTAVLGITVIVLGQKGE